MIKQTHEAVNKRSKGNCEIRLPGCRGLAIQFSHIKGRGVGGSDSEYNILHACLQCHNVVSSGKAVVWEKGYRLHSYNSEYTKEQFDYMKAKIWK